MHCRDPACPGCQTGCALYLCIPGFSRDDGLLCGLSSVQTVFYICSVALFAGMSIYKSLITVNELLNIQNCLHKACLVLYICIYPENNSSYSSLIILPHLPDSLNILPRFSLLSCLPVPGLTTQHSVPFVKTNSLSHSCNLPGFCCGGTLTDSQPEQPVAATLPGESKDTFSL